MKISQFDSIAKKKKKCLHDYLCYYYFNPMLHGIFEQRLDFTRRREAKMLPI